MPKSEVPGAPAELTRRDAAVQLDGAQHKGEARGMEERAKGPHDTAEEGRG